ncbi:MAG: rane protein [Solirubrobacterales bacterium]|nr:rane protein [Solirubrobacterales bacterium]
MTAFVAAGAGFLLAVLWFDLMFDVQVLGHRGGELPAPALDSICGYYARVTTGARPMNRLVAAVMLGTLGSIVAEIVNGEPGHAVAYASLVLAAFAILLAGVRTVPSAVRLGGGRDNVADQSALARSILRQHLLCFVAIAAVLTLQLISS